MLAGPDPCRPRPRRSEPPAPGKPRDVRPSPPGRTLWEVHWHDPVGLEGTHLQDRNAEEFGQPLALFRRLQVRLGVRHHYPNNRAAFGSPDPRLVLKPGQLALPNAVDPVGQLPQ